MSKLYPPLLEQIQSTKERVYSRALQTPLLKFNMEEAPAEIYLKLENLQPGGSYKIRGATYAVLKAVDFGAKAIWTASTGNMARAMAWVARGLGIKCHVVVPDNAPAGKLEAIFKLGAQITRVHPDDWFEVVKTHHYPGMDGYFIHPVADLDVMAGHGTMGLEIIKDLPDVDTVIVPYGGGSLTSGMGSALRALKPDIQIYACEVETGAPLAAALRAGRPHTVDYVPSFVDAIGSQSVLPEMWPGVKSLVDGSLVVSTRSIADAIRLLVVHNSIVAEGAGAAAVAAALEGGAGPGKIVAIVSGGNIDLSVLSKILKKKYPS